MNRKVIGLLIFLQLALASVLLADFKILGGKFNNQQGSNSNTRFDTDNDGVDDIVMSDKANLGIGTTAPGGNLHVIGNTLLGSELLLSDGTETAPALAFDSSDNTGLFLQHSAGNLLFMSSGTNALMIDFAGNIGVNTYEPDSAIHLYDDSATNSQQRIKIANHTGQWYTIGRNNADGYLDFLSDGTINKYRFSGSIDLGSTSNPYILSRNSTTGFLQFQGSQAGFTGYSFLSDDNNDMLTIIDNTYIGMGTKTPTGNLHVTGNIQTDAHFSLLSLASAPDAQSGNGLIYTVSDNLYFKDSSGNEAQITAGVDVGAWLVSEGNTYRSSGYAGLGTTSPDTTLHIRTTQNFPIILEQTEAGTPHNYIQFKDTGGDTAYIGFGSGSDDGMGMYNQTSGPLSLYAAGSTRLQINGTTGNIGFGDTSADAKLEIIDTTDELLMLSSSADADGDFLVVDSDGQMGIGTPSPMANLHLVGNAIIEEHLALLSLASAPDAQSGNGLLYTVSDNLFYKDSSGNEAQITDGSNVGAWTVSGGNAYRTTGFVGIGTSSANAYLEVISGNASAAALIVMAEAGQTSNVMEWQNSAGSANAIVTEELSFSNNGGYTNAEIFGHGASVSNTGAVVVGKNASSGRSGVAIGYAARAPSNDAIAIGYTAGDSSGTESISIGFQADAGNAGLAIGYNTNTGGFQKSIVIARNGTATAANQFVAGSSTAQINEVYFAKGAVNAAPTDFTIHGTGGSGTDISGANVHIAGGKGTGNADGGYIAFWTADELGSGTTLQSITEKMRLSEDGDLGIGTTIPGANVHVVGNAQIDEHISMLSLSSAPDLQSGNGLLYVVSDNLYYKDSSGNETQFTDNGVIWGLMGGNIHRDNGNVGIGTSDPDGRLHIADANSTLTNPSLTIDVTANTSRSANMKFMADRPGDTNESALITFFNNGATPIAAIEVERGSTDTKGDIKFQTSNSVKMTLDEDGNIGVGDLTPDALLELIEGSGNVFSISSAADADGDLLTFNTGGNLGLGTVSPSYLVDLSDDQAILLNGKSSGVRAQIRLENNARAWAFGVHESVGGGEDHFYIRDDTAGTNLFVVEHTSGFVGIGGANPTVALNVSGSGKFQSSGPVNLTFQRNGAGFTGSAYIDTNGTEFGLAYNSNAAKLYWDNDVETWALTGGNVGVLDTSPDASLEIIDGGGNVLNVSSAADNDGDFLTIDSEGNLGIGEKVPTQKLVIAGNIVAASTNTYTLGTSAISWDNIYAKDYTMISDKRLKDNIRSLDAGLGEILKLRPVSYSWKGDSPRDRQYGLIAQEVQEVLEDAVNIGEDKNQTMGVHYTNLVPVIIKAVQEQESNYHKKFQEQNTTIKELKTLIESMRKEIRELKRQ